uniref:Kinetochore protein Nuf2 N-terminal domain-containing protein n=1 Tax=Plectus sambesii TaxID=2011161 RepID=A0A914V3L1_9BILA
CDRLYPVYRALVQNALSIPDASLDQLPFEAQAGESDPELFRDACPKLILYKLMNSFINDITAHQIEFMLSDILTPQPKKTIQIVSVLVDFWEHVKFREERTNQIFRKFDERAERRELLLNKLTELKGKSEKKRSEKKGKDHLTSQKREQLQQLTEEMTKLKVDSVSIDETLSL